MSGPSTHKGIRGAIQHSPASSLNHSDHDHMAGGLGNGSIPRVPNASASFHKPAASVISETAPEVEPSTPAEYALNVVLTHFVTNAEHRIEDILQSRLVRLNPLTHLVPFLTDSNFRMWKSYFLTHWGQRSTRSSILY